MIKKCGKRAKKQEKLRSDTKVIFLSRLKLKPKCKVEHDLFSFGT